ncbi:MAG: class I SAM-dependent methyltransferase [Clostridia bacterium]|nr:class I SAM-dependent methyltransferase [Clostridia bacterium]
MNNDITDRIKAYWNETSDSEWYSSLRTYERIGRIKEKPESAFHPAVNELIRKYAPDMRGRRVLLPSSGDNHAAFAFSLMGAQVTSADISERQLENAAVIAERLGLEIEFICDDTMKLSKIRDGAYDMVYTSNGTLSWISDIDGMNRSLYRVLKTGGYSVMYDMHPFNRPFSGEAFKPPRIVKSYNDVFPDIHWRLQDIVNSQINAGLSVCELAELPAVNASFWFTYAELGEKSPEELNGINDWKRNPMAALPAWMALISRKALKAMQ